jgi:SagB-type dehydrogenase family enzyme
LNAGSSLLLLAYLAVTAGLGIFWVANQHLPVFDWHYLFGYVLVALVLLHLAFNLRTLLAHLRWRAPPALAAARRPVLGRVGLLGLAVAGGLGYWLGLRHGRTEWVLPAGAATPGDAAAGNVAAGSAAAAGALAEQFHALSSLSRAGAVRRAPSVNWGDAPPPFKPVQAGRTRALPPPQARVAPKATLDAAALGVLLWHTAGVSLVRGGIHFRTAPSSGALFATELYLAVRQVGGVAPGLWHYDAQAHRLQRLGAATPDGSAIGRPGLAWPDDAAAAVIATAVFRRSGRKYGDRAYRYMLADLGHALENLRVAAAVQGLPIVLQRRFDGAAVAAALGIDEAEEGVLMVALLAPSGVAPAALEPPAAGWVVPPLSRGAAPLGITDAVHRATSLRLAGAAAGAGGAAALAGPGAANTTDASSAPNVPNRPDSPNPLKPPGPPSPSNPSQSHRAVGDAGNASGGVRPLPPVVAHRADPLHLIVQRRSRRRFAEEPLALHDIGAVLAAMAAVPPQLSAAVRIHLLSLAVEGLPAGAWRYRPQAHALQPLTVAGEGLRRRARSAALDQDVIGDAAAVLLLTLDRAAVAADPDGFARGYRHAFLEAGLAGERAYLEAGARGLAVCGVGAFFDDDAAALIAADPAREWVVHFVALGRPA